jgi:DNA-binding transcriptional LysR family regulator
MPRTLPSADSQRNWQDAPTAYAHLQRLTPMPEPMEWSDLQVFLAVCAHGSIGAAAKALRVNHSTVLRRIAQLEASLAVRLFDRLPRGYALTAHGHELAAAVAGVPEQLDAAQRRVTGADLALAGTIRLTAPDTFLQPLLLPLLAEFGRRHPGVRIELVATGDFLNLTRREADVAVRGSARPPENLVGRRVGRIQTALFAAKDYLKSLGRGAGPADYAWVGHDAALSHLESAKWMRKHVAAGRVVLRVDSLVTLADAVAAGFGVGWLLCPLAAARPGLKQLQPPPPELDTPVWVLAHPDLRRVARIQALTEFLFERLSQDPRLAH